MSKGTMLFHPVKLWVFRLFLIAVLCWVIFIIPSIVLSKNSILNHDQQNAAYQSEIFRYFKAVKFNVKADGVENQKENDTFSHLHDLHLYEKFYSPTAPSAEDNPNLAPFVFNKNFTPAFILGRGPKNKVNLVIGIPSVKRPAGMSYLYDTLGSLFGNMYPIVERNVSIVVLLAEMEDSYLAEFEARKIYSKFTHEVDNGLLQIIVPRTDVYPDFNNLPKTLGDPPARVAWRAKEVYDAAYLMYFCKNLASNYYMMLEDDVITVKGFVTAAQAFASKYKDEQYIYLSLAKFNSIGKLFRSADINKWVTYFFTFFGDKPLDWLMFDLEYLLACHPEMSKENCKLRIKQWKPQLKLGLFQHIGKRSSYKGKTQKLLDKKFSFKAAAANPHKNPKAKVHTSFNAADLSYCVSWYYDAGGKNLHYFVNRCSINDHITIAFKTMQSISKIIVKSGNQGQYKFDEESALVEVTADKNEQSLEYETCALFDSNGWAECYNKIPKRLSSIRLRILKNIFHKVWLEYILIV